MLIGNVFPHSGSLSLTSDLVIEAFFSVFARILRSHFIYGHVTVFFWGATRPWSEPQDWQIDVKHKPCRFHKKHDRDWLSPQRWGWVKPNTECLSPWPWEPRDGTMSPLPPAESTGHLLCGVTGAEGLIKSHLMFLSQVWSLPQVHLPHCWYINTFY